MKLDEKNLLKALSESTNDYIYVKDLNGVYIFVNSNTARFYNLTKNEILGKTDFDFFPADLANEFRARDQMVIQSGHIQCHEESVRTKDGGYVYTLTNKVPYRDEDGQIIGVVGISRDITDRKKMEERLRVDSAFRKPIEESMIAGIAAVDTESKLIYVNSTFCKMVGYSEEELIGKIPPYPYWPEEDQVRFKELMKHRLEGTDIRELELKFRRRNGELFYVVSRAAPLEDERGNRRGILASYYDITDKKRQEAEISAERERLLVTLWSIGDAVVTTDQDGKVTLINPVAQELTGWNHLEAVGRRLSEVFDVYNELTGQPIDDPVTKVISTGQIITLANHTVLKSRLGRTRPIADSGAPIRNREGEIIGVVLVFRDVTLEQQMRDEVLKKLKLDSLGLLAGGIAHDFNNILAAILGNISLAKIDLGTESPSIRYLTETEQATLRARDLASQLLAFSKGGAPQKRLLSIRNLIVDSSRFALRGSNIKFNFYFPENLWPVEIDSSQITQVVHNIVINARQAMPGGGEIFISGNNMELNSQMAKHLMLPAGRYITLSFKDLGPGISPDIINKIFDPFFTTKRSGSGLGLFSSYTIAKNHDGTLTVDSKVNYGSNFTLYLPASPEKSLSEESSRDTIIYGTGRILLMDDDQMVRTMTAELLKKLGYEVETANKGEEVLEKYQKATEEKRPYEIVIMDLTVPGGKGGKDTLDELLILDPNVKAVVSSGYSNDPIMAEFEAHGFKGCVAKPYRIEDLSRVISRIMGSG